MFAKMAASTLVACGLVTSAAAHAAIFLDFEGSANGAYIQDFYNGGTDSFGNRGVNYGVTFAPGAQVRYDFGRTYLALPGRFAFNVAAGFSDSVSFLVSAYITRPFSLNSVDGGDFSAYLSNAVDRGDWTVQGNAYSPRCDPFLNTFCQFQPGFAGDYRGTTSYWMTFANAPWQGSFDPFPIAIDSITIGADISNFPPYGPLPQRTFIGDYIAQVPEPATTALLGLGLIGLVASRRRKIKDTSEANE